MTRRCPTKPAWSLAFTAAIGFLKHGKECSWAIRGSCKLRVKFWAQLGGLLWETPLANSQVLVRASNDVLDVAQGPPVGVGHLWPKLDALHGSTLVVVFRSQILHRWGTTAARKSNRIVHQNRSIKDHLCCHESWPENIQEAHGSAKGDAFWFEYLVTLHRTSETTTRIWQVARSRNTLKRREFHIRE